MSKSQTKKRTTLKIDLRPNSIDEGNILLASFPEGVLSEQLPIKLRRQKNSSRKVRLVADTEKTSLAVINYGRESTDTDSAQWLVGVYEPGSDTLVVHPVSHIFSMRSTIKVL
jgi:hypothetical protein